MKQNERLLVYAVSGFLAVILLIAVWFGNEPTQNDGASGAGVRSLGAILDDPAGTQSATAPNQMPAAPTGESKTPTGDAPLHTSAPAAAELVTQQLGPNRRNFSVRYVMPRQGDSLESLVTRWCGTRDFVEKAKRLNEELTIVKAGQEVAVPWVDDEALLEMHAARQATHPPVTNELFANRVATEATIDNQPLGASDRISDLLRVRQPAPVANQPVPVVESAAPVVTPAAATRYEVKAGDSLWRIAERTYGRKNADRMVKEILRSNPGLDNKLKVGQPILLPSKP